MTATTAAGFAIDERDRVQYAGFGHRLAAGLVDFLVLLPVIALSLWALNVGPALALATSLLDEIAYFAYTITGHARWGQTLGKRAAGIRVLDVNGGRIGWRQAIRRSSVDIVLGALSVLVYWTGLWRFAAGMQGQPWSEVVDGYSATRSAWSFAIEFVYFAWIASEIVSVLFNKRRRALHDFIAGTVVVVEPHRMKRPAPRLPGWRGVLSTADTVLIVLGLALAVLLLASAIGIATDAETPSAGFLFAAGYGLVLSGASWAARRSLRQGWVVHWALHLLVLLVVLVPVFPFLFPG